jgi:hypothetical protein
MTAPAGTTDHPAPALSLGEIRCRYGPCLLVVLALLGLVASGWFWWQENSEFSRLAWASGTVPVLLALLAQIVGSLRRGDVHLQGIGFPARPVYPQSALSNTGTKHLGHGPRHGLH